LNVYFGTFFTECEQGRSRKEEYLLVNISAIHRWGGDKKKIGG
jgi:hypothetical protein